MPLPDAPAGGPAQAPPEAPRGRHRRVCLRPGVHVVRRDGGHLQVGLGELAVVVPDDPRTTPALVGLAAGTVLDPSRLDAALLARLDDRDLLVDPEALAAYSTIGGSDDDSGGRPGGSARAAFARHGPAAATRLAARRAAAVSVDGPRGWTREARGLLARAGLTVRAPGSRAPTRDVPLLLMRAGEVRRDELDDAVRAGRPHLVVAATGGGVRVGPFVVPGVTACLRCLDAHASETDPRHPLLLEQLAHAAQRCPEAIDPVLGTLAVSHAVRDLVTWAEGVHRPVTWSAVVHVDDAHALAPEPVAVHPCCGCAWGNRLPVA